MRWDVMLQEEEKSGLGFFSAFCLFSPSLPPTFWVRWLPAATVLRTGAAQGRDRGDCVPIVPWSIPNQKSSISMGMLCQAAHRGHGAFADVLEQLILVVLKRLHKTVVAWCFNGIYCHS